MPQVIIPDGIQIGSSGFFIFAPPKGGNPNNLTTGLLTSTGSAGDTVALGSLFVDTATGTIYAKTASITVAAPSGTWTALQTA